MTAVGTYIPKEKDPYGIAAGVPGAKLDAGKTPVFRGLLDYFPRALKAVADLSAYGAHKYSWKGWEKVADGYPRYKDAAGRHELKQAIEGEWDLDALKDDKYSAMILHDTQIAWNQLAALELKLKAKEANDRIVPEKGGVAGAQL